MTFNIFIIVVALLSVLGMYESANIYSFLILLAITLLVFKLYSNHILFKIKLYWGGLK